MAADTDGSREGENSGKRKYRLKYYEKSGFFGFLFMNWPRSWMHYLSNEYVEIDELHPLPSADHISYWQPIFSKHVSDALLELEKSEYDRMNHSKGEKQTRGSKHIILRALLKTFWSRLLVLASGYSIMQMTIVGTSLLLKYLVSLMAKPDKALYSITIMIMVIVVVDFITSLFSLHLTFYFDRVHINMESVVTVTLFQHAMSHRRAYATYLEDSPLRGVCKGVVHSWPCKNTDCAQNPLKCPARRHQNKELPSSMYVYLFVDSYAVIRIIDAMVDIIKFLCTFIMSMIIIKNSIGMGVLIPVIIVVSIVLTMIMIEITHGYVWFQTLHSKDIGVMRAAEALRNLNALKIMGMEDVGYNMIQHSRDDEMMVLKTRTGLHSTSIFLNSALGVSVLLFVLLDYIKNMKEAMNYSNFDISAPITAMFIVEQITSASANLHRTMKSVVEFVASLTRIERFMTTCSPNYYIKPLEDLKPKYPNDPLKMNEDVEGINEDTLVQFKMASFNWICDRKGLFEAKEEGMSMLDKIDFELKRGEVRIVTGPQGCGKTSFIKSILGEMSLVSGSMAVAPLSTGMPIFYTSQEVWLPTDSIRAIITFGYAFDEEIYNEVVRCAELLRDFSSWDDGDMRVISEKGYSLSGGQRVRVSLARALYAYMVFSKANESLENNRCCFLMCLDEPFNGLDVNVATAIFNNLFNKETGLLVRDDVAIVMAMSKMNLNVCLTNADYRSLVPISLHYLVNKRLSSESLLGSASSSVGTVHRRQSDSMQLLRKSTSLGSFSKELWRSCENNELNLRKEKSMVTQRIKKLDSNYEDDLTLQRQLCSTSSAYKTFFSATGMPLLCVIVFFMLGSLIVEKVNLVWVAKWSDSIKTWARKSEEGKRISDDILTENSRMSHLITILSSIYMVLSFICVFLNAVGGIVGPINLHRFSFNCLFFKSSSVITLKKSIGNITTFLSTDFAYIDYFLIYFTFSAALSVIKLCLLFATVCYTIPISVPVPIICFLMIYLFLYKRYIESSKKGQLLMIEGVSYINSLYANVIEGSPIYRSYKKENQCMRSIYERSDYCYRSKFAKAAFTARFMMEVKIICCLMLLCTALLPILQSYYLETPLEAGKLGLGISMAMAINGSLTTAIFYITTLEKCMCSMARYHRYFIKDKFSLKEKFESMDETILSGYGSTKEREKEDKRRLSDLIKRRKREFRNFAFRRYRSVMNTLFYKPKIKVLDIASYLPADHTSLTLDKVFVPQPAHNTAETSRYILKNVSASTQVGDVIGIVGRTGAGKSTLLGVLQNITRNREGSVLLDGRELSTIPRSVLRHIIGVLPQIPFVFQGWTLRRFLDPRMLYSDEAILNALECCGMLDTVMSLPGGKGLDAVLVPEELTSIGGLYLLTPIIKLKSAKVDTTLVKRESADVENSSSVSTMLFSMGQLRLLSFARLVLYRETYRILLVDEPPSDNAHGDEEGNKDSAEDLTDLSLPIYDLVKIYFKHCTTFIVAHDRKILNYCNNVWEMSDGTLASVKRLTDVS
ncbi:hypothetical protein BgAZ_105550 [Babesia gibsoni]|uniref:ABC transporter n=1 Tax=Babesia gibsoni TaxID=33632 RepID=A0AAD8PG22_BABGI|nr:hypothetical protein BgAZ_105550 [Babesia gibsoni]